MPFANLFGINIKLVIIIVQIWSHQTHSLINWNLQKKIAATVTLRLSSNMICANETSFMHQLLLADRQVLSLCKLFTKN